MKYVLILFAVFFSACGYLNFSNTMKSNDKYFDSNMYLDENIKSQILIDDMIKYIKQYADKDAIFYLKTTDKNRDFFNNLVDALRQEGFAISDVPDAEKLSFLGYSIYKFENNVFVNINLNTYKINMVYEIKNEDLSLQSISTFTY